MYYFIHNTEDGLAVGGPYDEAETLLRIEGITSSDLEPEWRARFVDYLPTEYSEVNVYCVLRGEAVIPTPVTTVTKYAL